MQATVDADKAKIFESILEKNRVAYLAIAHTDNTGDHVTYILKDDPATRERYKNVQVDMEYAHNNQKEMTPDAFRRAYLGKDIATIDNLTRAEIVAVRHVAKHYNVQYTVVSGDKPNTYAVVASDKQMLHNMMRDVAYNISRSDYKTEITQYANIKDAFLQRVSYATKDKPLYIVDAKRPTNYIMVTDQECSKHHIIATKEDIPGGKTQQTFYDNKTAVYSINDKDYLMQMADTMRAPVILTAAEMGIIDHITKNGKVMLTEDVPGQMLALKDTIKDKLRDKLEQDGWRGDLKIVPTHKNLAECADMAGLVNLPRRFVDIVAEAEIPGVTIAGQDICYPARSDAENQIKALTQAHLYDGLSDLAKVEAKYYYSGAGNLILDQLPRTPQYILNADAPGYAIANDRDGLTIMHNGMIAAKYRRDSKTFAQDANKLLLSISHPAVLSVADMQSAHKMDIVSSHLPDQVKNSALDQLRTREAQEKVALHNLTADEIADMTLSDRQQAAMDFCDDRGYHITSSICEGDVEHDLSNRTLERGIRMPDEDEPEIAKPKTIEADYER